MAHPSRASRSASRPDAVATALTLEVVARLDQALRARPIEDLPSDYARPLYEMLTEHGFDRSDLLSLAASLVDLVTSDVSLGSGHR